MALKEELSRMANIRGNAKGFAGGSRTGRTVVPNRFDRNANDVASRRAEALKAFGKGQFNELEKRVGKVEARKRVARAAAINEPRESAARENKARNRPLATLGETQRANKGKR